MSTEKTCTVQMMDTANNLVSEIELTDLGIRGLSQISEESEIGPEQFEPLLAQLRRTLQTARELGKQLEAPT